MNTLSYKTISTSKETASHSWHVIDAENQIVGRLASRIAKLIRGKNKPDFTPHANTGDKVIVLNVDKVRFTGKKMQDKVYTRHTGYPGGQRFSSPVLLLKSKPGEVLRNAVKGMLPGNKLREPYLKNLHLYVGTTHPHMAQNPKPYDLNSK
ncbi:MAG: 50S ribosomal protein L13 [Bacteroidetes bacterium]|nr:50S ribosomal protein L13 [Bacteroidota bacterium]